MSDDSSLKIVQLYSAKNKKEIVAERHLFQLPWILFSSRVLKNSFIRKFLKETQNSICPICNDRFNGKMHLHHIDYDHICQLGESIEIETGKISRTGKVRIRKTTNCEKCFTQNREYFDSCCKRLIFVHNHCHSMLHNENKRKQKTIE